MKMVIPEIMREAGIIRTETMILLSTTSDVKIEAKKNIPQRTNPNTANWIEGIPWNGV